MLGILINCFFIICGSTLGGLSPEFIRIEVFYVQPETENRFNLAYDLNQ